MQRTWKAANDDDGAYSREQDSPSLVFAIDDVRCVIDLCMFAYMPSKITTMTRQHRSLIEQPAFS